MRIRRKKNLEARIEACKENFIYLVEEEKDARTLVTKKLDYKKLFNNDNPTVLELGCGKGRFSNTLASLNQNINVLAVEKIDNVLISAAETAKEKGIKNAKFLCLAAEYLIRYIPEKSIDNIYLNFSCPYPKKRFSNRRLTNPKFLKVYKEILKDGGFIYQKTDNREFFEYSLINYTQNGFYIEDISLDLHKSNIENNIMTEYEEKFVNLGLPIYYAKIGMKKENE